MPDEAIVTTAAPSAPASEASPAISDGGGGGTLTDEQILGTTEEAPPSLEATEQVDTAETPATTTVDDYAWAKPLYKEHPQLQSLVDRMGEYGKIGSVADVRKLFEIASGDVTQVEKWKALADETEQVDLAFTSGDPDTQRGAIQQMYELDPESFEASLPLSVEFLRSTDPQRYAAVSGQILADILGPEKFGEHLDAMARSLDNPEALKDLASRLVGWAQGKRLAGAKDQPLDPRAQALERQTQTISQQKIAAFGQTVSQGTKQGVEAHLDTLLKDVTGGSAYTEAQVADIRDTVIYEVGQRLASDRVANLRFQKLMNESQWLERAPDATSARVAQAKAILPTVLREVLDRKSKLFMGAVQARQQKITTAQQRREVGGSGGGVRAAVPPSKVTDKTRRMTDAEILGT